MSRRIYVASSWRNVHQPGVVAALREAGHEVYDFRNPRPGDHGFDWAEIDPAWENWTTEEYAAALQHRIARHGFGLDFAAMQWADTCVLVLPAGRSANIEAGWCVGSGREVWVLQPERCEPELMYAMCHGIVATVDHLIADLADPRPERATADAAVRYLLDRVQTDPDFRYHMLGTQSLHLLCLAEAGATGRTVNDVKDNRTRDLQPDYRWRESRCALENRRADSYAECLDDEVREEIDERLRADADEAKRRAMARRSA